MCFVCSDIHATRSRLTRHAACLLVSRKAKVCKWILCLRASSARHSRSHEALQVPASQTLLALHRTKMHLSRRARRRRTSRKRMLLRRPWTRRADPVSSEIQTFFEAGSGFGQASANACRPRRTKAFSIISADRKAGMGGVARHFCSMASRTAGSRSFARSAKPAPEAQLGKFAAGLFRDHCSETLTNR